MYKMSDLTESKTDLPESVPSDSNEEKSIESARNEDTSNEGNVNKEILSDKKAETNFVDASLNKDAPQDETDDFQNDDIIDEPSTEVVSDIQNPKVIDESPTNDEILDTQDSEAMEEKLTNNETLDILEKSSAEEDAHKKSPPEENNLTNENAIEENLQKTESNTSEAVVKETVLKTEDSISGDGETENMEVEMAVSVSKNPLNNEMEETLVNKEVVENPLNKELEENQLNKEIEENVSNKEIEENISNKEIEENRANKEIEENMSNKEVEENMSNKEVEENMSNKEVEENIPNKEIEENISNKEIEEDSLNEEKNEMEVDEDESGTKLADAEESEMEVGEDMSTNESEEIDMKNDDCASKNDFGKEKEEIRPDGDTLTNNIEEKKEHTSEDGPSAIENEKVLFIPIELDDEEDMGEYEDFTAQEIMEHLEKKINDYMLNPEINDLSRLQTESNQLREQVKAKSEEVTRLQSFLERLYRDQEKMLRYFGVLPKPPTRDIEVFVDMPSLENLNALNSKNAKEQIPTKENVTPCGISPKNSAAVSNAAPNATSGTSVLKNTTSPVKKENSFECIDLTDDADAPSTKVQINKNPNIKTYSANNPIQSKQPPSLHPAPLPIMPFRVNRYLMEAPPKPRVKINCDDKGIILQWDADLNERHEKLQCFEIFGYQEQSNQNITSALWKRIGNVKTLSLPMACTLTKFVPGNNYHFTVRGLDIHNRPGTFSDPVSTRFDPPPKMA